MRLARLTIFSLLFTLAVLAQSDRGTITGTISDPAGALVPGAPVQARNVETGAVYEAAASATGNYTLPQLPTGNYELSVTVTGFKKYVRQNLFVPVAQTLRIDIALEVGSNTESITVSEAAPLLKTESGELSHNVTSQTLGQLPILGIGSAQASSSGIRNPLAASQLIPGTTFNGAGNLVRVNGAQGNTNAIRIEGQDATNGYLNGFSQHTQPSVDAIQEISIQTSNFSAEFGQVGGGFFNFTMRSGSNQFHGSMYDYFVNDALNAGQPYTDNGRGGLIRGVQRRNDYGATLGGPVWIPKVYDGRNKTFFFVNWEQFRESQSYNNVFITLPIQEYRDGNFRQNLTARTNLAADPLGRAIPEGAIYDPKTQRLAPNGVVVRDQYVGNRVPTGDMDPVALRVQALIPAANIPNLLVMNALFPFSGDSITTIPAIKIDHSLSSKAKFSVYWSTTKSARARATGGNQGDGLPFPITEVKGFFIQSQTERVNFDYTLSPTLLLHLGAGFLDHRSDTTSELTDYDALAGLGLKGIPLARTFPKFQGLTATRGGMKNMGNNDSAIGRAVLPTANASLTWVKNNHTFKGGAEMRLEGFIGQIYTNTSGFFTFSAEQTGLPIPGLNLGGGTIGFPYASFLLGQVASLNVTEPPNFRLAKQQWGFFIQDTWKVTRKLTLDYGLRYDYSTYFKEQYGRLLNFSAGVPNPSAGGRLGAVIFEGNGPNRCGCNFANNYPLALGPRLGAAYQLNSKTVIRAGFGIVYTGTGDVSGATGAFSVSNTFNSPSPGAPFMLLQDGITLPRSQYQWPNFDPGQFPKQGSLTSPNVFYDQNAGRPARQWQWSIGVQREILRDLVVETSYVANRGVWWNSPGLININALTPEILASYGLNTANLADRNILNAPLNSANAGRFQNRVPYAGFPTGSPVSQSLRPYPQFGNLTTWWSPLGKTWYDSLQTKVTKRFSRGLQLTSVFTWQKQLAMGSPNVPNVGTTSGSVNDVFNRDQNKYLSQFDQPFMFNLSATYVVPTLGGNKILSWAVRDWTLGVYLGYASGMPIAAPAANNQLASVLFRGTFANRVPGVPLFTKDLNCHCFDPNKEFVLNPAAWSDPAAGQWGTAAAYYSDYRLQRRPVENFNFGRTFRIREGMTFNVRAEFTNVLNRTQMANPTSPNAAATQTCANPTGAGNVACQPGLRPTGGFGWINTSGVASPPRAGVIVGRFQF